MIGAHCKVLQAEMTVAYSDMVIPLLFCLTSSSSFLKIGVICPFFQRLGHLHREMDAFMIFAVVADVSLAESLVNRGDRKWCPNDFLVFNFQ